MSFEMDPEVRSALQPLLDAAVGVARPAVGDWRTRRDRTEAKMSLLTRQSPVPTTVATFDYSAPATDGAEVPLRLYRPEGTEPNSGLLIFLHGGGQFCNTMRIYDPVYMRYAEGAGVPVLAVDFRFAPEHPFPNAIEDSYSSLCWAEMHARELDCDPGLIAVAGDSAGGGMAAALALMTRDREGPSLSGQVLIYPMLDDRTVQPDPELVPVITWNYEDNATGWGALLGDNAGGVDVSAYAAPARANDLSDLPPAYIEIGQLDIFRDETVNYSLALSRAGVPVELHVHPGAPHGYDQYAPRAGVSTRAIADRYRVIRQFCGG